jgi:hypothetical protein
MYSVGEQVEPPKTQSGSTSHSSELSCRLNLDVNKGKPVIFHPTTTPVEKKPRIVAVCLPLHEQDQDELK